MLLAEILDSSVPFTVKRDGESFLAKFEIDGNKYTASAGYDEDLDTFAVSFSQGGHMTMTGTGNEFKVLATMKEIVQQFIDAVNPSRFTFSADIHDSSRVTLYSKLAKKLAIQNSYKLKTVESPGDMEFWFSK